MLWRIVAASLLAVQAHADNNIERSTERSMVEASNLVARNIDTKIDNNIERSMVEAANLVARNIDSNTERSMVEASNLVARNIDSNTDNNIERSMVEAANLVARSTDSNTERSMVEASNLAARNPDTVGDDIAYADRVIVPRAAANATGSTDIGNGIVLNADGTINMTAWDAAATAACNRALSKLTESTNPSGTCTCYNLPALNNVTGAFEADLRLFQISTPRGTFSGISPENVQVGLSYSGASVSPVSAATASALVVGRDTTTKNLKMLQQYLFVGQIRKELLSAALTMGDLEALVMPLVTLTATNTDGTTVATNVSSNEAAFVAGVFSDMVILSTTAKAQLAVDGVVAGLANGTVAFVVPGVQLMLFPTGLIITSIWLVIGIVFIGIGFFQRVSFRESYRTRAIKSVKTGAGRI